MWGGVQSEVDCSGDGVQCGWGAILEWGAIWGEVQCGVGCSVGWGALADI